METTGKNGGVPKFFLVERRLPNCNCVVFGWLKGFLRKRWSVFMQPQLTNRNRPNPCNMTVADVAAFGPGKWMGIDLKTRPKKKAKMIIRALKCCWKLAGYTQVFAQSC